MITVMWRFLLFGTLFGYGVFTLAFDFAGGGFRHSVWHWWTPFQILGMLLLGGVISWPFALIIAALPAAASAAAYLAFLRRFTRKNPNLRSSIAGFIGGCSSAAFSTMVFESYSLLMGFPLEVPRQPALFGWFACGAVAAALGAVTMGRGAYASAVQSGGSGRAL